MYAMFSNSHKQQLSKAIAIKKLHENSWNITLKKFHEFHFFCEGKAAFWKIAFLFKMSFLKDLLKGFFCFQ